MKTWEIYKMLDEWNPNSKSPYILNKSSNMIYIFTYDNGNKGIKLANEMGKAQYMFSLNGEWELIDHTYDVGDIVVNILSNKIHTIRKKLSRGQYLSEIGSVLHDNNLRKATDQEIRLMRKWHDLGRKVNEFKKWDIIKDIDDTYGVKYREVLSVDKDYLHCTDDVSIHESRAQLVTPLERRFDAE